MTTLEEVIEAIESQIPSDWNWLVRKHKDGQYFANIMPVDIMKRSHRELYTCPSFADTPLAALKISLAIYQTKDTPFRI